MAKVDELVKKLEEELGIEKIDWIESSDGFPKLETEVNQYFLTGDTIFVRNKETRKTTCYSCGEKIKTKTAIRRVGQTNQTRKEYDYWCPTCNPQEKSESRPNLSTPEPRIAFFS